jgi:hypothetical protein
MQIIIQTSLFDCKHERFEFGSDSLFFRMLNVSIVLVCKSNSTHTHTHTH